MSAIDFKKIHPHPAITEDDYVRIKNAHKRVEFSKNEMILNEGKISDEYFIIEKGLFRSFVHDYNGNEITTSFFGPNDMLVETASFFQQIPTQENFQALTDGVGWRLDFHTFQQLFDQIPGLMDWGRTWMAVQLFKLKQRSINMLTQSATERYLNLIEEQPQIIKHAPLKHIATYLGVTDTSLSRIRKEISQ